MRLLPCGPRAVLAEFDGLDEVIAASAAWRDLHWTGVVDIVPAARTVLVVHDGTFDRSLLQRPTATVTHTEGALVTVPVVYDGEDLDAVAAAAQLTTSEVVDLHVAPEYRVAFCGFMPGFSYLVGLDERLHLPRLSTPRTRVPHGAVAIAAGYTAVYPRQSPGGWHLLGHTDLPMWDAAREVAATLPPGSRVRFEAR